MAMNILPGENMVIRPLKKRFSLFRGRVVWVLKGSTKKSAQLLLDFFGGLVGYICTPGLYVSRDDQFVTQLPIFHQTRIDVAFRGRNASQERLRGRLEIEGPVQLTQISLKLNPIFLPSVHISSMRYKAKYFLDELLFLSFFSSHVKF